MALEVNSAPFAAVIGGNGGKGADLVYFRFETLGLPQPVTRVSQPMISNPLKSLMKPARPLMLRRRDVAIANFEIVVANVTQREKEHGRGKYAPGQHCRKPQLHLVASDASGCAGA